MRYGYSAVHVTVLSVAGENCVVKAPYDTVIMTKKEFIDYRQAVPMDAIKPIAKCRDNDDVKIVVPFLFVAFLILAIIIAVK